MPIHTMKSFTSFALAALVLASAGTVGYSQIKRLSLTEIVSETDDAIVGHITNSYVFRVDHPVDGPELYFTTLTIAGKSLADDTPMTLSITYPGGFIDPEHGVWNSEAPTADDVQLGNYVVAFYEWTNDMGGQVAGNALYAMHGGLYRTVSGPQNTVVLGRGDGYAISSNTELTDLTQAARRIRKNAKK